MVVLGAEGVGKRAVIYEAFRQGFEGSYDPSNDLPQQLVPFSWTPDMIYIYNKAQFACISIVRVRR